jgi:hypothetical protein
MGSGAESDRGGGSQISVESISVNSIPAGPRMMRDAGPARRLHAVVASAAGGPPWALFRQGFS